ncbi:hypothetical protein NKR19_g4102 [Coniochaeta hoffmannii]|uniref:Dpy-30 domain-containing protein n=1 Tax=Coniochaeta hoffmannii TaxID=91930 RepID=A0AA38W053_9PEZI|nr:hypothetical protein NKR19_g4102 [Coniochaeta hoffmannii]
MATEADPPASAAPPQPAAADVHMTDATPSASLPTISEPQSQQQQQPLPQAVDSTSTPSQSPAPPAKTTTTSTGAPLRNEQQQPAGTGSRAQSVHPDQSSSSSSSSSAAMPSQAAPHGAQVRQYLNSRVTPALLEGMKKVGKEQPSDPLRVLGEFLLQKSKELEGKN